MITWLTQEHIDEQLAILEPRPTIHAMVATYILAGLRREEAIRLTPADVDMANKLIRVHAKTVDGEFWQPKTKRNRVVPIGEVLLDILKRYRQHVGQVWFFPSPMGKRWDPDNFSETLRKINRVHGLNWSCLDFRHTFGSHLAQSGASLYEISELMGNSPEICRRHYAALVPEKMHAKVDFYRRGDCDQSSGSTIPPNTDVAQGRRGLPSKNQPPLRLVR